ncbi:MAG: 1-(5-phosphoribosyl)-5-[(5-phosphoribosylamino)methylideneamino]imidazole-4-carboxamide isomerase [Thermodesulfobacteriota bacterium]
MLIIPAIDLKGGRCVRLAQGRMDAETVYSEDPVDVARGWEERGANLIHLVDLDGAVEGAPKNIEVIKKIIYSISIDVQVGGGIRDVETVQNYLKEPRVKRVIIGTAAYNNPALIERLCKEFPGRIAVGIDARDGMVAIKGWVEVTEQKGVDLARRLEGIGVSCIVYTDIARDGMLVGPNVKAIKEMAYTVDIPVIASGGMSTLRDIESLRGIGAGGVIIGKALYTGDIDLSEAIEAASRL